MTTTINMKLVMVAMIGLGIAELVLMNLSARAESISSIEQSQTMKWDSHGGRGKLK